MRFRCVTIQTSFTAALTGREPTGIIVKRGLLLTSLSATIDFVRMTAMSPDCRFSTNA